MSASAQTDFASRTLADIASTLPGATALFRSEKLDFCCGGKVTLAEAMAAKQKSLTPLPSSSRPSKRRRRPATCQTIRTV